ncbi:MAG TPA: pilus assembly protein PilP [Thermoanaerobaculia bacterium]|nr:pilus assembly protein PilP [Thermoanaerobaculia bacterium]
MSHSQIQPGLVQLRRAVQLAVMSASLVSFTAYAQPAPSSQPAAGASSVEKNLQEILEEPATYDTYRYDPQGRRDPFRSLIGPSPKAARENAPKGTPGFLIDEMRLQGIFRTKQGLVAMVIGPDNSGHLLKVGDKVFDGEVVRLNPNGIVFRQEVNDPTRIERFREVTKELASQTQPRG